MSEPCESKIVAMEADAELARLRSELEQMKKDENVQVIKAALEISSLRSELAAKDALLKEAREAFEFVRGALDVPHDGTAVSLMNTAAAHATAIGMLARLREGKGGKG